MCQMCSNDPAFKTEPNTIERAREITAKRDDNIMDHGHSIVGVMDDPPFTYTVGRSMRNNAELLITLVNNREAGGLLNHIARLEDEAKVDLDALADQNAEVVLEGLQAPLRFIWADPHAAEMFQALNLTSDLRAIQIVWPSVSGLWPGDEGYEHDQAVFPRG